MLVLCTLVLPNGPTSDPHLDQLKKKGRPIDISISLLCGIDVLVSPRRSGGVLRAHFVVG
jgi:hypothetical protein